MTRPNPNSSPSLPTPPSSRPSSPGPSQRPQIRSQSTTGVRRDRQSPHISPSLSRGESPHRSNSALPRLPPSYANHSLDRTPPPISPSGLGMVFDDSGHGSPRVPRPIFLRPSSPQGTSSKGQLRIHIPAWGVVLIRPPRRNELLILENGEQEEPQTEDTLLTGSLEVIMKERKRCQSISIGVQSVSRLYMGDSKGWEEDGIFERGVEILNDSGSEGGIWLEKGSQSFSFSILLPATLATHDRHQFGRVSYILTALVEGIPMTTGVLSFLKSPKQEQGPLHYIPFKEDFDRVIARSDKLAQESGTASPRSLSPQLSAMYISDESAVAMGDASPILGGSYHRRLSSDMERVPSISLSGSRLADDNQSVHSVQSTNTDPSAKTEKNGWLKGDLHASRSLIIHANPSPIDGVTQLDIRKEGRVDELGPWRFTATSDAFSISGVVLFSLSVPAPSPLTTIYFTRVLLVQDYTIVSPRRPHEPPHRPENPKNHVLYQVGRPHRAQERFPGHHLDSLWRGPEAGGTGVCEGEEAGWTTKAVARLPNHDKIRPTTNPGTITPIRVTHDLVWQVFYSVEGQAVCGTPIEGPGELRMMAVRMPICVPSCCCTLSATILPTCENAPDIDKIISSPPDSKMCQCGYTFAELGEAAMRRMRAQDQDDAEGRGRDGGAGGAGGGAASGSGEEGMGSLKLQMERRGSSSSAR